MSGLDGNEAVCVPSYWFTFIFMAKRSGLVAEFKCCVSKVICNIINIMFNNIYVYVDTVRYEGSFFPMSFQVDFAITEMTVWSKNGSISSSAFSDQERNMINAMKITMIANI